MKVPVKILLAKNWLTGGEANSLLDHLCACSVPAEYFIEAVGAQEVDAYITSEEARRSQHGGWIADTGADLVVETLRGGEITIPDDQMAKAITGQLFVRERGPEYGLTGHDYSVYLDGSIFECKGSSGTLERWIWRGETPGINSMASAAIYFKPSDIQALANTINGTEQPATDAGEAEQLRQRIAELEAQADQQAQRIAELEAEAERTEPGGHTDNGLTFPYTTPELLAMHAAALKYWAEYNAETDRKPLQKEIGLELTEALALKDSSGQPSRQAAALATAIQPEKHRG